MITFAANTHRGCVRKHNEDCYRADSATGLWLVADGVGGHTNGEVASALTGDITLQVYKETGDLTTAIKAAHQAVLSAIEERGGTSNMGSTIVAITLDKDTEKTNGEVSYEIAWVGDSRAYLWNGELKLLTRDHSYVETLVKKGLITQKEAQHHPKRNIITQSIGISPEHDLQIDSLTGTLQPNQKILLCSDGLNDEINFDDLADLLGESLSPERQVDSLMQAALDSGGKDNVTILLLSTFQDEDHGDDPLSLKSLEVTPDTENSLDATIVRQNPIIFESDNSLLTETWKKVALVVLLTAIIIVGVLLVW